MGVEDGCSLGECLDRAKTVEEIPRVLKAFENLRRPRAESMIRFSRETMSQWHLPDGEQQRQRDQFWSKLGPLMAAVDEGWDRKHVDEPPKTFTDPLLQPYFRGYNAMDFVSLSSRF
jgi:salicylate hydroxylase